MRGRIVLVLLACGAAGCAKSAPSDAHAPEAAGAAPMDYAGEADMAGDEEESPGRAFAATASFEDLQAHFDELDADLSAQGIVAAGEPAPDPTQAGITQDSATDASSRCERICSLAQAICDVSERICSMAEEPEHEGDDKYVQACTRSEARCEQATEACTTCR